MNCVIIGAGKIARGFIGHLLYINHVPFTFVEKSDALCDLINARGAYTVNILGDASKNCRVTGVRAIRFADEKAAADAIADAGTVFTAVGGKNLRDIAPLLAGGITAKAKKGGTLNIVTCENWKLPATLLKDAIEPLLDDETSAYFKKNVGLTEAVIMRSAIEADAAQLQSDPLIVNVQNFWDLPLDAARVVGELPPVKELRPIAAFEGFLERKFYTYNAANGTVSYLGALLGFEKIADAAHDARILEILEGVYRETATALSRKHNFPFDEQMAFTRTSKAKLQDYTIVDFIERNARDPIRKLGPDDRLVGSARLALEYGVTPENLAVAIAAAIFYKNDGDEFAVRLAELRREKGVEAVLREVCQLDPAGTLGQLILGKVALLREKGWIRE